MLLRQKRIQELCKDLSNAISNLPDEVSRKRVHSLRVAIRRIEALIRFAHPSVKKKEAKAMREMKALRRQAGKIRDIDVHLRLLGAFANGSTAADRRMLTDILKRKRARQAHRLESEVAKLADTRFLQRIRKVAKSSIPPSDAASAATAGPLDLATTELAELGSEVARRFELKPSMLHQARIRLKKIRYLAELDESSEPQQALLADLKTAQDALGEWHDWELLTATAEKYFGDRINCALLVEARSLSAARRSAATSAARHLFSSAAPSRKQPRSVQAAAATAGLQA